MLTQPPEQSATPQPGGPPSSQPAADAVPDRRDLQLPRETIERLKTAVFGFDTFFVTSVENYEAAGVLFKGNLRGDPAKAYSRMAARLLVSSGPSAGVRQHMLRYVRSSTADAQLK